MRELYQANSANYSRLKTDKLFVDYKNTYKLESFPNVNDTFELKEDLFSNFVRTQILMRAGEVNTGAK